MLAVERLAYLGLVGSVLALELMGPLSAAYLLLQGAERKLARRAEPVDALPDVREALSACGRVNDLLGAFRAMARDCRPSRQAEAHAQRVAETTIHLWERAAGQARLRLRAEGLQGLPGLPIAEEELAQVFFALVQNAVHAADGAQDRDLLITGALHKDGTRLRFQDNCGELDPACLPRIFDPLFHGKPPSRGIGLALWLARRIVRQRGGQITMESQLGQGTAFIITLPHTRPEEGGNAP